MAFSSTVLTIEMNGNVATLWLDRPEKLNAMGPAIVADLPLAMAALGADDQVRAVVIAARGRSFSVGLDLSGMIAATGDGDGTQSEATANLNKLKSAQAFQQAISSIAECPVPVIAAIHSHCLGAGIDLITACDVRVAAADAMFGVRETKIGIVADVGTLQRLPGIVGAGHVAELVYTGKDIGAERAEKIGLINDVYPDAEATYQAACAMAREIAANAPLAVRGSKFMLQQNEDLTTEQSLLLNGLWTMATTLNSNDLKEAVTAFAQKRAPSFTGT